MHSRGWQRGFNSAMADVSEMQRPSASLDFIHRRHGEWKSNEWHPAPLDIVRSNSRYEVRETAGRRRGCHSRSRACAQTEGQEVYEKRFKSDPIDFPGEAILAVVLRRLDATDHVNNLPRTDQKYAVNEKRIRE